jgi:ABC-type molybdate transport system permease subunit
VQESVLDTAATRLDALSAQRAGAESYVDEHLEFGIGDTGLLLATILLTTGSAAQDVRSALASIGQHLDSAARELRDSAATYRATDDAVDRRLDALHV